MTQAHDGIDHGARADALRGVLACAIGIAYSLSPLLPALVAFAFSLAVDGLYRHWTG